MIFYIPFSFTVRPFIEICINTIKYELLLKKENKYIVYILDCYFNYQWIFFAKTKKTIF